MKLVVERLDGHPKTLRRAGFVALMVGQSPQDVVFFHIIQRHVQSELSLGRSGFGRSDPKGEVLEPDFLVLGQNFQAFDRVLEFPDVAGPVVGRECFIDSGVDLADQGMAA